MNEKLLNQLKTGNLVDNIYAQLVDEKNNLLFEFLFNPERKSFSMEAKYQEVPTALTSLPISNYSYSTGETLTLSNLILLGHGNGKVVKELIDRLKSLMKADPINKKYEPIKVKFVWGADSFGPAVITNIQWEEDLWLNGEVAGARLGMTLKEVPSTLDINTINNPKATKEALKSEAGKTSKLTARQKEDASKKAKQWLNSNVKKLKDNITALVRANNYKLSTADDGTVTFTDSKGKKIGTVGIYRDTSLVTTKTDLLK